MNRPDDTSGGRSGEEESSSMSDHRAELRTHTRALSALREPQLGHYVEHQADMAKIKRGLAHIVTLLQGLHGDAATREP